MRSPRRLNPMVVIHCESNGWRRAFSGTYGPRVAGNRILVTGSAGHLGEALVRVLRARGVDVVGLDVLDSPFTTVIGSVGDRDVVRRSEEHTSELQSRGHLVWRLLLEKKKKV